MFRKNDLKKLLFVIAFAIILFCAMQNIGAVWHGVGVFFTFLRPVLFGLASAYVMNVLMRLLEEKVFFFLDRSRRKFVRCLRRPICLTLTLIFFIGLIVLLLFAVLPNMLDALYTVVMNIPSYFMTVKNWFIDLLDSVEFIEFDTEWLKNYTIDWSALFSTARSLFNMDRITEMLDGTFSGVSAAATFVSSAVGGTINFIFGFFIAIYFLAEKERISRFVSRMLYAFLPEKISRRIHALAAMSNRIFSGFIFAQCAEAIVFGTMCFIGMCIFRFRYAGIISVVIGITALVPIVGPTVGIVFGALMLLTVSPLRAVLFVAFVLVLQQIDDNLIYPRVVGSFIELPTILVLSSVLIGGSVGGILGTFLGVPVCAVLYRLLRDEMNRRGSAAQSAPAQPQEAEPATVSADADGQKKKRNPFARRSSRGNDGGKNGSDGEQS